MWIGLYLLDCSFKLYKNNMYFDVFFMVFKTYLLRNFIKSVKVAHELYMQTYEYAKYIYKHFNIYILYLTFV